MFAVEAPRRPLSPEAQQDRWRKSSAVCVGFLRHTFGVTVDAGKISVPPVVPGKTTLVVVPAGLTVSQLISTMRKNRIFMTVQMPNSTSVECQTDALEEIQNDRPNTATYAVWMDGRRVNPDDAYAGYSATRARENGVKGVTLIEYLLRLFAAHQATNRIPDHDHVSICSGSQFGASVPIVKYATVTGVAVRFVSKDWSHHKARVREVSALP